MNLDGWTFFLDRIWRFELVSCISCKGGKQTNYSENMFSSNFLC